MGGRILVDRRKVGAQGAARARNPQGQGGRLRAELIAAADRLIAQTGDVEGLSLRAVAREVGAATPSIYLHFPDKAALVRAVLEMRFAELGEAVRSAVEATPEPAQKLRAGCLAYCRFAIEHPNAYRVLFGRAGPRDGAARSTPVVEAATPGPTPSPTPLPTPPMEAALASHPGAAAFGFLVESIAAYMQYGLAPAGDPFRVATNVWAALHGIVSLRSVSTAFPWPPLGEQVDDVLRGLVGVSGADAAQSG